MSLDRVFPGHPAVAVFASCQTLSGNAGYEIYHEPGTFSPVLGQTAARAISHLRPYAAVLTASYTMCCVILESFLAHGTSPCCGTSRRGNITHVPQHNTLRKGSRVIHCDGIDSRVSIAGRRTCGATGPVPGGAPPTGTWPSSPWWTWRWWSWSHKICWTRWSTRH